MADESNPEFPNYQPPSPQGIPIADRQYQKPLNKILFNRLKKSFPKKHNRNKWSKKNKFY